MTLLAGEGARCRIVLGEALYVRLVHPGGRPQAPGGVEFRARRGPRAPARGGAGPLGELVDVGELLAGRLAVVEVPVQGKLARRDVAPRLDTPGRHVGILSPGVGRVAPCARRI